MKDIIGSIDGVLKEQRETEIDVMLNTLFPDECQPTHYRFKVPPCPGDCGCSGSTEVIELPEIRSWYPHPVRCLLEEYSYGYLLRDYILQYRKLSHAMPQYQPIWRYGIILNRALKTRTTPPTWAEYLYVWEEVYKGKPIHYPLRTGEEEYFREIIPGILR